ncbi:hypothetical protein DL770_011472 [Monosporascus sp. CRB-9-2]|nr:hypothetical protein DL770_011472 [Monosporascus sp. CRB-9-2]
MRNAIRLANDPMSVPNPPTLTAKAIIGQSCEYSASRIAAGTLLMICDTPMPAQYRCIGLLNASASSACRTTPSCATSRRSMNISMNTSSRPQSTRART